MTNTPAAIIKSLTDRIATEIGTAVFGHEENTRLLAGSFLVGGHVLIEGVPGLAKTLLAKTFAEVVGLEFRRIQFTPDLMPTDVTGVNVYDQKSGIFRFAPGPLLSDIVLADEINRTPPKTQSALLEAMEEHQVTVDGTRHHLSPLFFVLATQNPIEHEGTFPLPEAQLDRFFMKLDMTYPSAEVEAQMIMNLSGRNPGSDRLTGQRAASQVTSKEELLSARQALREIRLSSEVASYIVSLLGETRAHTSLLLGGSPRSGLALALGAKLNAGWSGRDYVIPDDVKEMFPHVVRHRLVLKPEIFDDGVDPRTIVSDILHRTPVPSLPLAH